MSATYDLDALGWLFERLATDAVEREIAVAAFAWPGASDELHEAICNHGVDGLGLAGPVGLRMACVPRSRSGAATGTVARILRDR